MDFATFAQQHGYSKEEIDQLMQANPDMSQGAPAGVRAQASFLSHPADRVNLIKKRLGEENVAISPRGEVLWRKPQSNSWHPFDEPGLSWGDVADWAGDTPEIVGGGVGAVVGGVSGAPAGPMSAPGMVAGAAAGSGIGNVIKQAAGRVLLGQPSEMSDLDRAKEAAGATALGGAGQWIGNKIGGFLKGRGERVDEARAYKEESDRLSTSVGGGITGGQRAGGRNARIIEDQIRRNAFGGEVFEKFEIEKQVKPLYARINRITDELAQGSINDKELGTILKDTVERTAEKLRENVQREAARDARFFDELVGRTPAIPVQNFMAELQMLAKPGQELSGFSPEVQKLARWASKTLSDLEANKGTLTADQMQSWLHDFSLASAGKGRIADALSPDADRRLASKMASVLDRDLNMAAEGTTQMLVPQGVRAENAAKLLRQFRDNYRTNSQAITELGNTVLARRFKGEIPPESIGRSAEWLRSLRPDEVGRTMEILEISRPGIREVTMKNIIEDAVMKAEQVANKEKDAYGRIPISMDELRLLLPDDKKIKAILGNNHIVGRDIADVVAYLNRATGRTLTTMSNQETWVKTVVGALKNPNIHSLSAFAPRLAAEAMTDPSAFRWLRTLAQNAGKGGAIVRRANEEFSKWALPRMIQMAGHEEEVR